MRIRHYAQGKFYTIECPEGSQVIHRPGSDDHLIVPLNGQAIRIPADPPELLPMLAESGKFGVTLAGEPEPEVRLDGVSCPNCGKDDVAWLQLRDGEDAVHCDECGAEFAPVPSPASIPITRHRGHAAARSPGAGDYPEMH